MKSKKLPNKKLPKEENLIHIKIDYDEAIKSKSDILSSEMSLLNILKNIRKYHSLRLNELRIKINLYNKLTDVRSNIKRLNTILPKIKISEVLLNKEEELNNKKVKIDNKVKLTDEEEKVKIEKIKEEHSNKDLEDQLMEIKQRLSALQR